MISTRKALSASPFQSTFMKRSGFLIRERAFLQSARWMVMPLPSEM